MTAMDFSPLFFPTKATVLGHNICGSRTAWQFASCSSVIPRSAPNVDFISGFTCPASWSPCDALCPYSARMANPEKQHFHLLKPYITSPYNQGINQTTRHRDFPEDILLAPIFFSAWSCPVLLNGGWFCSASFQYQLHTYICALAFCNLLFGGRLLCWPKCEFCWCQFSGIFSQ